MSGALAPGKQWTMVAGVSIFTFRTIELPITRALSSVFSVGASLSGENLFNVLIGTEEWCFDPRLCRLTVTQLPCCTGSSGTEQCTGLPELVASKAVSTALTFLLSSTKVWMRVSSSKIFSVSLSISLHLSFYLSLSLAIPLGTSTKRAVSLKEQITDGSHLFKDVVLSVSSLLWSLPVFYGRSRSLS